MPVGVEVEIVNPNPKPPPEKVLKNWTREWFEQGRQMELSKPPTRLSFEDPPRSLGHGVADTGGKLRLHRIHARTGLVKDRGGRRGCS